MAQPEPGSHAASPNPRRLALEVISQALSPSGGAFAQELLDDRLDRAPMKPEDKRLAADLTYGVIRRLGTLDSILSAYSTRPLADLEPGILHILRIGAYHILFQERIPHHAAVDECVTLARATGKLRATGFVNAVLRSIAREVQFVEKPDPSKPRQSFPLTPTRACVFTKPVLPPPSQQIAFFAALYSFPSNIVARWLARYGTSRARELFDISNELPPLFARPNLSRITLEDLVKKLKDEGVDVTPNPDGRVLRLPPHTQLGKLSCFTDGLLQIQDAGSAAVAPFLGPKPGDQTLDLCAAPGGKACHMAELMRDTGRIVAVDISERRLQRVAENTQRLGHPIIVTVASDGGDYAVQNPAAFDRVLIDAPCSNTGVLRRRVEARWRFSDESLASVATLQKQLLSASLRAVKPGIVYSTCSLEPEENSLLVASVLRGAKDYRLDAEQQLFPERDGGDGLYMARIVRAGGLA